MEVKPGRQKLESDRQRSGMRSHPVRVHGLGGERQRNHLFRWLRYWLLAYTIGLVGDTSVGNLKRAVRGKDRSVSRW